MDKIIFKKVGQRLRQARELRKITLEEAGKQVDVHKSTVLRWENGETEKIKLPTLEKLSEFYNVNPTWLAGYDVPMEPDFDKNIQNTNSNYFEFVAEDDAMYPLLDVGDIAVVYKQNTINDATSSNNAGTYLIKMNNKRTIRTFLESQDKTSYTLEGRNIACKPIVIKKTTLPNELTILGKVVEVKNKSAFK